MKKTVFIAGLIVVLVVAATAVGFLGCSRKADNIKPRTFTVTFDIEDYDIEVPAVMTVTSGARAAAPELHDSLLPQEGYRFAWYADIDKTELFDFDTPIESDITLYLGEDGLVFSIAYTNLPEGWFDIDTLPTSYKAGVGVAIPSPNSEKARGYYQGHWYDSETLIGYGGVSVDTIGNLELTYIVEAIPYSIIYTNLTEIGGVDYSAYITNPNPLIHKVTDGTITLQPPIVAEGCPLVFSRWVRVKQSDHTERHALTDPFTEITPELLGQIFIRAVWE